MKYSQNDEQEHILAYFGQATGKLLDIGAADGIEKSNTRALIEKGWSGVLCEPSPGVLVSLYKNCENLPVEIMGFPIGTEAGVFPWYDCGGDQLSSVNPRNMEVWKSHNVKFTRNTFTNQAHFMFLKMKYGDTFDFINVDVEGNSADLALAMFKEFPACRLWCIEHDSRQDELTAEGEKIGLKRIAFNGENLILGK